MREFILKNCVERSNFILHSGGISTIKVNCDKLFMDDELHREIITLFNSLLFNEFGLIYNDVGVITGPPRGATPIIEGLVKDNYLAAKNKEDLLNLDKFFRHKFPLIQAIIIVDDVITTGNSIKEWISYIPEKYHDLIIAVVTVVNRTPRNVDLCMEKPKRLIPLYSLFDLHLEPVVDLVDSSNWPRYQRIK